MQQIKLNRGLTASAGARTGGFTLVEIMVVVAILGLLAVMVVPQVFKQLEGAQEKRVMNDIRAIEASLKFYKLDSFSYPSQSDGLQALVSNPGDVRNWRGPYLESLPLDPWDNEYRYTYPGTRGKEVEVYTYGADNTEGGEGADADLGSWNIE